MRGPIWPRQDGDHGLRGHGIEVANRDCLDGGQFGTNECQCRHRPVRVVAPLAVKVGRGFVVTAHPRLSLVAGRNTELASGVEAAAPEAVEIDGIVRQRIEHEVLLVTLVLPGLDPTWEIETGIQPGLLRIFASRPNRDRDQDQTAVFSRLVAVPTRAALELTTARYASGVLTVRVPLRGP